MENSCENILNTNLEQISLDSSLNEMKKKSDDDLYGVFVSIGKHSYLCPRTQQFFAKHYPNLPQKRPSDENTPLINEIIIDEFSLLLFHSLDDYNVTFIFYFISNKFRYLKKKKTTKKSEKMWKKSENYMRKMYDRAKLRKREGRARFGNFFNLWKEILSTN